MSAGWVAAQVRGRGLARHRLGGSGAREVARTGSLDAALAALSATSYRKALGAGMDLPGAEHSIWAGVLWNLRVLAGWGAPLGGARMRLLAAPFEMANINAEAARLAGDQPREPYRLGSLSTVTAPFHADSLPGLRRALAGSAWGDPGSDDLAGIRLALQFALARRVADGVPEAAAWATSSTVLALARCLGAGALPGRGTPAADGARRVLGDRWAGARNFDELADSVPRSVRWTLAGVRSVEDLWRPEARWWARLEVDSLTLASQPQPGPGAVVGVVGLLAADAWRVVAALEVAARGGRNAEVLDEVA